MVEHQLRKMACRQLGMMMLYQRKNYAWHGSVLGGSFRKANIEHSHLLTQYSKFKSIPLTIHQIVLQQSTPFSILITNNINQLAHWPFADTKRVFFLLIYTGAERVGRGQIAPGPESERGLQKLWRFLQPCFKYCHIDFT